MFKFNNIHLDDETMWPNQTKIELEKPFEDDRGSIQSIVNFPMKNLSMIFSHKGKLRANHVHITDWHYMYIVYGAVDYYYRKHGSDEQPKLEKCIANDLVFTPPMEDHAMVFTEETLFVCVSRNPRGDQETYESDVKRIHVIDPDSINQ
jgi:dTDP-4-dehydrorhamnose 3,5-epimerase-like enzyme